MNNIAIRLGTLILVVAVSAAFAPVALAQASRTWVSGVGDDVNPCSRTAPCKTFAGAISKTAAGGEISVLDPGGYGGVTITKSITINGRGTLSSILVSGTAGITINAGANDVVFIRGVEINGVGTGTNGINFIAGGALHVEDCDIYGFSAEGINFAPTASSELYVSNATIRNNAVGAVYIHPGASGNAFVAIGNVQMVGNGRGLRVEDGGVVLVKNSVAAGGSTTGFNVATASRAATLTLDGTASTNNTTSGIRSVGPLSSVRITGATVVDNGEIGLASVSGGNIISFGNNRVFGNAGGNGAPTATSPSM